MPTSVGIALRRDQRTHPSRNPAISSVRVELVRVANRAPFRAVDPSSRQPAPAVAPHRFAQVDPPLTVHPCDGRGRRRRTRGSNSAMTSGPTSNDSNPMHGPTAATNDCDADDDVALPRFAQRSRLRPLRSPPRHATPRGWRPRGRRRLTRSVIGTRPATRTGDDAVRIVARERVTLGVRFRSFTARTVCTRAVHLVAATAAPFRLADRRLSSAEFS